MFDVIQRQPMFFFSFIFVLAFFICKKTLNPAQIMCLCVNQCYHNRVYDDNRTICDNRLHEQDVANKEKTKN